MKNPKTWDAFCESFDSLLENVMIGHKTLIENLMHANIIDDNPNILFYGANGFPVSMLIDYLIRKKFGDFSRSMCQVTSDMEYFQCQYFIEFDFYHPNFQKNMTHCIDLIKQIVQSPCIYLNRHIVILKNIDGALSSSKQMFRVLLERFSANALFICTTNAIAKVEAPIKSRFMLIRIPLLSSLELQNVIKYMGYKCPPCLHDERNLFKALLLVDMLESGKETEIDPLVNMHFYPIKNLDFEKPLNNTMESIRTLSNKICQGNIQFTNIVLDLLRFVPDERKQAFILKAAETEQMYTCTNGGRRMLYIERLIYYALYGQKQTPCFPLT